MNWIMFFMVLVFLPLGLTLLGWMMYTIAWAADKSIALAFMMLVLIVAMAAGLTT